MVSYRSLLVASVSVAAWVWCAAGAFAQRPEATPYPDRTGGRLDVTQPLGNIIRPDPVMERRYKVEAIRFKAVDESGYDWDGSDEVIVETLDAKGGTSTREIGDIDSGDVHDFDPAVSCIVAVRDGRVLLGETSECDSAGEPAPFWFKVRFWENDNYEIFPPIDWNSTACVVGAEGNNSEESPPGRHCSRSETSNEDLLGGHLVEYSQQELDARLPNVGDQYEVTVRLDPCFDGDHTSVCGVPSWPWASFPDYDFTYRITRLPDRIPRPPEVDF